MPRYQKLCAQCCGCSDRIAFTAKLHRVSDTLLRGVLVPTTNDQRLTTGPDELWMEEALRAAQRALEAGEVPVGAVVVCKGRLVGRGWNRNLADSDPTAHAEIVALREAGAAVGNHRPADCHLLAPIDTCAICA